MSEEARLLVWMVFIVWDCWIILDYEWNRRERYDKKRNKGRKVTRHKGHSDYPTLIWNDMDRLYGGRR